MQIGICSFSFHRLLAAGKQDIFQYIIDCKELGCTQLDPWNAHLSPIASGDKVIHAGHNPDQSNFLNAADEDYIGKVRAAADKIGLPFGCIAVDGAHIYDAKPEVRAANRARAYRWIDVAHKLGAKTIRVDTGGPKFEPGAPINLPDDVFKIIVEGYNDIIARAKAKNVSVVVENHWGPTVIPDLVIKFLDAIPQLGFLHDLHNWRPDLKQEGRVKLAKRTDCMHIKTFEFDKDGNESSGEDVPGGVKLLLDAGFNGVWGVESCPKDGDEIGAARKTIALLKKLTKK